VALAGWRAIFVVNVPLAVLGVVAALAWIPKDADVVPGAAEAGMSVRAGSPWREALRRMDLPAVAAFVIALTCLLAFLLSITDRWWLLAPAAGAALLFVRRELRTEDPFVDLRLLARGRRLLSVFGQFTVVNIVFYSVFFGLPLWLEHVRDASPEAAGLLLLPVAALGAATTPLVARSIERSGPRPALVVGAVSLTVGSLLLLPLGPATPTIAIVGVGVVLGIPNGFNNLGLQAALYQAAPPERTASSGGLFQTCRYLGAILSTALLGGIYGKAVTTSGFHTIAIVMAVLGTGLVVWNVLSDRSGRGMRGRG
jgi:predicted MFS family arabinose efflux permease